MGYLSQEPSVFQKLSVRDNLMAILETTGIDASARRKRCDDLLEQFGLVGKSGDLARTCSGGERRRLEIARAMITEPQLLLLDEPFAAVDPHTVEELQSEVRTLANQGIAILVTDHNVQQTPAYAMGLHPPSGPPSEGDPKQIINDPAVKDAHLASTSR